MSRVPPHAEITARRPDWLAEDAVRRETVSRADLPAIFDLQGDFQKLQGEPILLPVSFSNNFKILERVLPDLRSREHFWKEQGAFLVLQGRAALNCEWWQGWRAGENIAIEYRRAEDQRSCCRRSPPNSFDGEL